MWKMKTLYRQIDTDFTVWSVRLFSLQLALVRMDKSALHWPVKIKQTNNNNILELHYFNWAVLQS
jgi:hypothetical protein